MINLHGILDLNGPHRLIYLNVFPLVGRSVLGVIRRCGFVGRVVSLRVYFENWAEARPNLLLFLILSVDQKVSAMALMSCLMLPVVMDSLSETIRKLLIKSIKCFLS